MSRRTILIVVAAVALLSLSGCGSANESVAADGAGFLNGLWDGWTVIFAFIGNLFGGNYGIYEIRNQGGWYDFGFLLGIGGICGSGSVATPRRS